MPKLLHILAQQEADRAEQSGVYAPASLGKEGFIHLSYTYQVCRVANYLYKGQMNLVLLEIDPLRLGGELVDEDLYNSGESFPHLYGPLPWNAVTAVHTFPCHTDGRFDLPASLGDE